MRNFIAQLNSVSPYSQSRFHNTAKLPKEQADDYEKRTWRERMHYDETGQVFIPQMALKNAISEAAKYLSKQIPGKGKATYTKHFEAGVLCLEPIFIGVKKDDVEGEWLHLNSDGKRGGGSRVMRCMPCIRQWQGAASFVVIDDIITKDVFLEHLQTAGQLIGIGRFRPRNNGFYGRFFVESLKAD